jgi:hypothetical protein
MNSWITSLPRIAALCGSLALCMGGARPVRAQDQDQNQTPTQQEENTKPKPAAHAPIIDTNEPQDTSTDPNALKPDTTPLTGVQTPGLGTAEFRHSFWVPGFQIATTAQNGGSHGDWFDTTYLSGNLSLSEAWAHSHLTLNYSGGGYFSTDSNQGNGSYQQLGLAQSFHWSRWELDFFDEFSYLPTSQFGFGGLSNIGTPGVGGSLSPGAPGLGGNFVPDQTVLTASGPRYSNSFATQANFLTSPRGSITLVGSYGILRFSGSGNIDNDDVIGSIGYNYAISRKDTIGILYRFTAYHFSGLPQAIGDHVFNLAYSRRITGRLAISLFGGPEITNFRIPIGTETDHIGGSFGASAAYGLQRGGVTLTYSHGTTGGSGIVAGATGDNLTANATRQITRQWSARGNFGYGRTHAFNGNGVSTPGFNSFYFGAGLDRPLGRNALLSFGYTGYLVHQSDAACGGTCSSTFTQHQIAVGFQWHTRPFVLR